MGREGKRSKLPCRNLWQSQSNQPVQADDDCVTLEVSAPTEEALSCWGQYEGPSVGFCLLCGRPILSEDEFIIGSNYVHNCAVGRASLR